MLKKCNITKCPKCEQIQKHGKFEPLTTEEMETLEQNCDIVNIIDFTCPRCLEGIV